MTGYITDFSGNTYELPALISWEICHTDGTRGADSVDISCVYSEAMNLPLENAVRLRIEHGGETVFFGIVDEYCISRGENGRTARISGRGLGGILLDNKCMGQEFMSCTMREILSRYVYPFGITDVESVSAPVVSGFSVKTGESCWGVLSDFLSLAVGTVPRFDRAGRLVLSGKAGKRLSLSENAAIKAEITGRRYGVISQVDAVTSRGYMLTVKNERFISVGGLAKKVVTVPLKTTAAGMRIAGEALIRQSERERYTVEITVPELFPAFPGDIVELNIPEAAMGAYHVAETVCFGGESGAGTKIVLTERVK